LDGETKAKAFLPSLDTIEGRELILYPTDTLCETADTLSRSLSDSVSSRHDEKLQFKGIITDVERFSHSLVKIFPQHQSVFAKMLAQASASGEQSIVVTVQPLINVANKITEEGHLLEQQAQAIVPSLEKLQKTIGEVSISLDDYATNVTFLFTQADVDRWLPMLNKLKLVQEWRRGVSTDRIEERGLGEILAAGPELKLLRANIDALSKIATGPIPCTGEEALKTIADVSRAMPEIKQGDRQSVSREIVEEVEEVKEVVAVFVSENPEASKKPSGEGIKNFFALLFAKLAVLVNLLRQSFCERKEKSGSNSALKGKNKVSDSTTAEKPKTVIVAELEEGAKKKTKKKGVSWPRKSLVQKKKGQKKEKVFIGPKP
jgi:hypothetical protein